MKTFFNHNGFFTVQYLSTNLSIYRLYCAPPLIYLIQQNSWSNNVWLMCRVHFTVFSAICIVKFFEGITGIYLIIIAILISNCFVNVIDLWWKSVPLTPIINMAGRDPSFLFQKGSEGCFSCSSNYWYSEWPTSFSHIVVTMLTTSPNKATDTPGCTALSISTAAKPHLHQALKSALHRFVYFNTCDVLYMI